MKFLIAKSKYDAVQVAKTELLWKQTGPFKLLDLFREEVMVITRAAELRGHNVECVYLMQTFDDMEHGRWEEFQRAFAMGNIKQMRV